MTTEETATGKIGVAELTGDGMERNERADLVFGDHVRSAAGGDEIEREGGRWARRGEGEAEHPYLALGGDEQSRPGGGHERHRASGSGGGNDDIEERELRAIPLHEPKVWRRGHARDPLKGLLAAVLGVQCAKGVERYVRGGADHEFGAVLRREVDRRGGRGVGPIAYRWGHLGLKVRGRSGDQRVRQMLRRAGSREVRRDEGGRGDHDIRRAPIGDLHLQAPGRIVRATLEQRD